MPDWWDWTRFFLGILGAVAPEIVTLYKLSKKNRKNPSTSFSLKYFIFSALYLGLAGVITTAWGEDNPLKCLWIGCSSPLIIAAFRNALPMG